MEILSTINKLRFKDSVDLIPTIHASGFAYTPPRREERVIFEMGSPDARSFLGKRSEFVGSMYPAFGDLASAIKEGKFRVVTISSIYIVEDMELLNDNEDARCYTFVAKNIIERKM